jgi:hypothetical protein
MPVKRMSIGWTFLFGMLFGALFVFSRIGTPNAVQLRAHASSPRSPDLSVPAASLSAVVDRKEPEVKPSPVVSAGAKSRSRKTPSREIRHPECELQLD